MKRIIFVIFVVLFVITGITSLPGNRVYACSCAGGSANEKLERSTEVFEGKVIKIGDIKPEFGGDREYTFEVHKSWKGIQSNKISIYSYDSGSCGFRFDKNKTYLVFTFNKETNFCSGNLPKSQAEEEIKQLGIGTMISQHDDLEPNSSHWSFNILVVIAGIIIISITIIGIWRYRKKINIRK